MSVQHNQKGRDGRGQQGEAAAGEATRPRRRIPGVRCATLRSENRDTFNVFSQCGEQPYRGPPVPRDPHAPPVEIDTEKLQARRTSLLAKLDGQPGQQRKSKIADDFDAFLLAYLDGYREWETATDSDVFDWCCYLESQGRGTTWVHDASCPEVGSMGKEACAPTSGCAKQYAAGSISRGFVSKLRMAMKEMLGKGEQTRVLAPW